jgi:transposase-like protein
MAMKKRVRRTFTEDFKKTAAKRVADGEKATTVAKDVGVSLNSLRSWKEKPSVDKHRATGLIKSAVTLFQENALLRAENEYLKRREEILRK